jgi:GNAT superfamily N-acetyltransferase
MMEDVRVRRVGANEAASCVERLADVLIDCVNGGATVSFMPPLSRARALAFWRGVAEGVERNERVLLVAEDREDHILGTVQMIPAVSDNQQHRADITKMLVHRKARRRGIGRRLMAAITEVARAEGKTVLVLNTEAGSEAERLYDRAGWQRAGTVPKSALTPDGRFCSATFYYKHL